jgi:hypothetical protein
MEPSSSEISDLRLRSRALRDGAKQPLLDELFRVFERDDQPTRSAIIDALSVAGTTSATETLRVIEYQTAGRIAELNSGLNADDAAEEALEQLERGENLDARKEFLAKVREAITQVANRPDPQNLAPEKTSN